MTNITLYDLLYSLFNQYVFQYAKNNIEAIDHFYSTNPSTMNNRLVTELISAVRSYNFESIDLPLFKSILSKCNKTVAEESVIINEIIKWKQYDKNQIIPQKEQIEGLVAKSLIDAARSKHKDDPAGFIKAIKNSTFNSVDLNVFTSTKLSDIDINSILADNPNDFIPSRYEWINKSFDPYPGYEKGQMVIICSPPGVGKSLWLMSEALNMSMQQQKVLYCCLGDNKMKDFVIRMGAIYTGQSFADVHRNLGQVYQLLNQACGEYLEISINAANKVSAEDIVDYATSKEYDVVIVDYDGNLKGVEDGDRMYSTYGIVYAKLNELVLGGKLVFIASQPKISAWGNSTIEMQDIGESSRKQHTADMIIGIGREYENPNHLHTFKISKSRRGEEGVKAYTIRLNNGRFKELPKGVYDNILKNVLDKRVFTEAEIDAMVAQYNTQVAAIQQNLNVNIQQNTINPNPQQQSQQLSNPFGI